MPETPSTAHGSEPPAAARPLSKDKLLLKRPLRTRDVEIPGRGLARLAPLTEKQKQDINRAARKLVGDKYVVDQYMYEPRIVAAGLIDDDGERMFPDHEAGAIQIANVLGSDEISALFEVELEISAMTKESRAELGKGSGRIPSEPGSPSSA